MVLPPKNKTIPNEIPTPVVLVSPMARLQIRLLLENDFTLMENGETFMRISIKGKGCDGFTYSVGPSTKRDSDFVLPLQIDNLKTAILLDPFAAFYLQEAMLDFIQDFEDHQEGFVVINYRQNLYHGKFWQDNETLIPPLEENV